MNLHGATNHRCLWLPALNSSARCQGLLSSIAILLTFFVQRCCSVSMGTNVALSMLFGFLSITFFLLAGGTRNPVGACNKT